MPDQNPDIIIDLLKSVGVKGCLDKGDRFSLVRKDWINRRSKKFWNPIAEPLSKPDLENLFRGLVTAERELKWAGGSGASAIWVFLEYQKRFENASIELANWALANRGHNLYIPFGGRTNVTSHDEWVAERHCINQRYKEHLREQKLQQEEKDIRQEKRLGYHRARLRDGKVRAKIVKEYNKNLSMVNISERLNLIAHSDMPLKSVASELLDGIFVESPLLDEKTTNILLKKIDRRNRGCWGKIKRALLLRSLDHQRDELSEQEARAKD